MDIGLLTARLKTGLDLARGLSALPGQLGIPLPGAITTGLNLVEGLSSMATKVLERAETTATVITSTDKAEIQKLLGELQAENDALNARVAAS